MFTPIGFAGTQSTQPARVLTPKRSINMPHLAKSLTSDVFFSGRAEEETPEQQIPKLARLGMKRGLNLQVLLNEATAMAAAQNRNDWQSVYVELLKQKLGDSPSASMSRAKAKKTSRTSPNKATSPEVQTITPRKALVKSVSPPPTIIEPSGDEMDIDSDSTSPEATIRKLEKQCKQNHIPVKELQATAKTIVEAEGTSRRSKVAEREQTVYLSLLKDALNETHRKRLLHVQRQELAKLKVEAERYGINIAEIEQKATAKNNRTYDRESISHRDKFFIRYLKEALAELDQDAEGEDDDDFPPMPSHHTPHMPQQASMPNTFEHYTSMPFRPLESFQMPAASAVPPEPLDFEEAFKRVTGFDLRANGYLKQ